MPNRENSSFMFSVSAICLAMIPKMPKGVSMIRNLVICIIKSKPALKKLVSSALLFSAILEIKKPTISAKKIIDSI